MTCASYGKPEIPYIDARHACEGRRIASITEAIDPGHQLQTRWLPLVASQVNVLMLLC